MQQQQYEIDNANILRINYSNTDTRYSFSMTFREGIEQAEAEYFAGLFPKGAKVQVSRVSTFTGNPGDDSYHTFDAPYVHVSQDLRSTRTTGEYNEAGLRRVDKFEAAFIKLTGMTPEQAKEVIG